MTDKCYSANDEDFDECEQSVIEDVINNLDPEDVFVGNRISYYVADVIDYKSSDFITDHRIQSFFEDLNCEAVDEAGEHAEDFGYHSEEAGEELKTFLKQWMDKNVTCSFYGVRNSKEEFYYLTQDDVSVYFS